MTKTPQIRPLPTQALRADHTGTMPANIERPELPVNASAAAILRYVGEGEIATLMLGGDTQSEIAEKIGVTRADLAGWLYNLPPDRRAVIRAAAMASAEALTDQAGDIIDAPGQVITTPEGDEVELPISAAQVSLRKLRADHRYRKAAQRNASYRDKGVVDTDAPATSQAPQLHFTIRVLGAPIEARPVVDAEWSE